MVFQDGHAYLSERDWFHVPVVFDNLIHSGSMPVTIGIFINPGHVGDKTAISQFSLSLLLGLLPTLAFLITVWLATRAGLKLVPMILMGYGVWAIGASLLYLLRNILGVK